MSSILQNFSFLGKIPSAKSITLRALIAKSFFPEIDLQIDTKGDDVQNLQKAIEEFSHFKTEFDCGMGAACFRFLALRVSREPGSFFLKCHPKLLERSQEGLKQCLSQLGVNYEVLDSGWKIEGEGWRPLGDCIYVNCEESSQFFSSLLLNSWSYEKDLFFSSQNLSTSRAYLDLSIYMLKDLGMQINKTGINEFCVPAHQIPAHFQLHIESDMDSLFFISALAALSGSAKVLNFSKNSRQPSAYFVKILEDMGVKVVITDSIIEIFKSSFRGGNWNLKNTLDLAPVLSALLVFAEGRSHLTGLENLKNKESHRLERICTLFEKVGVDFEKTQNSLKIEGKTMKDHSEFMFDPNEDHRMVMAAYVLKAGGANIEVLNSQSISKSYPEFQRNFL